MAVRFGTPRCSSARFVTGNYNYETGSITGILGQLKWESLKKRRKDNRLISDLISDFYFTSLQLLLCRVAAVKRLHVHQP